MTGVNPPSTKFAASWQRFWLHSLTLAGGLVGWFA